LLGASCAKKSFNNEWNKSVKTLVILEDNFPFQIINVPKSKTFDGDDYYLFGAVEDQLKRLEYNILELPDKFRNITAKYDNDEVDKFVATTGLTRNVIDQVLRLSDVLKYQIRLINLVYVFRSVRISPKGKIERINTTESKTITKESKTITIGFTGGEINTGGEIKNKNLFVSLVEKSSAPASAITPDLIEHQRKLSTLLEQKATESEITKSGENPHVKTDAERIAYVTSFFRDNGRRELILFSEFLSDKNPLEMLKDENDRFVQEINKSIEGISDERKLKMYKVLTQEHYKQFKLTRLNAFFKNCGERHTFRQFLQFLAAKDPSGMRDFIKEDLSNIDAMPAEVKLSLDKFLNDNWSEYEQFKRSHLVITALPGSPIVKILDTHGDGDCAFRAMAPENIWQDKIGETRKWAADLLLKHIGDHEVRRHISAEIAYRRDHGTLPQDVVIDNTTDDLTVVMSYIEHFVRPDVLSYVKANASSFQEANYLEMPSAKMKTSVATALAYLMRVNLIVVNAEDGAMLYGEAQRNPDLKDLIVAQDGTNHVCRTEVIGHL